MHGRTTNLASVLPALLPLLLAGFSPARAAAGVTSPDSVATPFPRDSLATAVNRPDSLAAAGGEKPSVVGSAASFVETFTRDLATQGTFPYRVARGGRRIDLDADPYHTGVSLVLTF